MHRGFKTEQGTPAAQTLEGSLHCPMIHTLPSPDWNQQYKNNHFMYKKGIKTYIEVMCACLLSHQVVQLSEDHLSVGSQDVSVVTLWFSAAAGQQNHQDTSEQRSGQTLQEDRSMHTGVWKWGFGLTRRKILQTEAFVSSLSTSDSPFIMFFQQVTRANPSVPGRSHKPLWVRQGSL